MSQINMDVLLFLFFITFVTSLNMYSIIRRWNKSDFTDRVLMYLNFVVMLFSIILYGVKLNG